MEYTSLTINQYNRVLLVEDDEVDVLNVKRAFTKKGFRQKLEFVSNGLEAIEFLAERNEEERPDIILLDLNMPRMSGLEFLQEAGRKYAGEIDIYIMSTSSEESDIERARELGAKGYIVKPLFTNEFADELEHILG